MSLLNISFLSKNPYTYKLQHAFANIELIYLHVSNIWKHVIFKTYIYDHIVIDLYMGISVVPNLWKMEFKNKYLLHFKKKRFCLCICVLNSPEFKTKNFIFVDLNTQNYVPDFVINIPGNQCA
jgi:hypothetical protein